MAQLSTHGLAQALAVENATHGARTLTTQSEFPFPTAFGMPSRVTGPNSYSRSQKSCRSAGVLRLPFDHDIPLHSTKLLPTDIVAHKELVGWRLDCGPARSGLNITVMHVLDLTRSRIT